MKINFASLKESDEKQLMHSKCDNIDETNNVIMQMKLLMTFFIHVFIRMA